MKQDRGSISVSIPQGRASSPVTMPGSMRQHRGLIPVSVQLDRASTPVSKQPVAMPEERGSMPGSMKLDRGSVPGSMQQDSKTPLYDNKARRLRVDSPQSSVTDTLEKKLYKTHEKAATESRKPPSRKPSGSWTTGRIMPATPAATKQVKYRAAAQWDNTAVLQAEARADCHRNPTSCQITTRSMPATA